MRFVPPGVGLISHSRGVSSLFYPSMRSPPLVAATDSFTAGSEGHTISPLLSGERPPTGRQRGIEPTPVAGLATSPWFEFPVLVQSGVNVRVSTLVTLPCFDRC